MDLNTKTPGLALSRAPIFPGLECIYLNSISGGAVQVVSGDKFICTVGRDRKNQTPYQVIHDITETMLIAYVGVYKIIFYGGICGMFFERIDDE